MPEGYKRVDELWTPQREGLWVPARPTLRRSFVARSLAPIMGGAVAFATERAEDPDTANTTAYTVGAAFTPTANTLLILGTYASDTGDATYAISGVAGGGLTWNSIRVDALTDTNFYRLQWHYALVGGSPASTTVVVTYDEAITGCIGWVGEFTGHNTTTPVKANHNTATATSAAPSVALTSAPDSDSMVVAGFGIARNPPAFTPDAGWNEQCDNGYSTPAAGLVVVTGANDQSASGTWVNGVWLGSIIEIDAAAAATPSEVGVQYRQRRRQLIRT